MDREHARRLADKYILPDGSAPEVPKPFVAEPARPDPTTITIPMSDYKRLVEAAQLDDVLDWCENCGAWLDMEVDATCSDDGVTVCMAAGTGRKRDKDTCKSYRSIKPR